MQGFAIPVLALASTQQDDHALFFAIRNREYSSSSQDDGQSWADRKLGRFGNGAWGGLRHRLLLPLTKRSCCHFDWNFPHARWRRHLARGVVWLARSDVLCLAVAPDFAHSQMAWAGTDRWPFPHAQCRTLARSWHRFARLRRAMHLAVTPILRKIKRSVGMGGGERSIERWWADLEFG